ncbi:MAG TPA: hypothetical protein VKD90_05535, partial [Gemmataceae bacterium]|nr:hypothetical protein [Gemmataceae bacterium]
MTRREAETLFPNEWVLMDNTEPVTDGNYRGRVLAHGKDKTEILRQAKGQTLPREVVVFFTGPVVPPGMKVLL